MLLKGRNQSLRKHRHSIAAALALAHDDFTTLAVHILYTQGDAFHEAHARALDHARHEPMGAFDVGQQPAHLRLREHRWQAPRRRCKGSALYL